MSLIDLRRRAGRWRCALLLLPLPVVAGCGATTIRTVTEIRTQAAATTPTPTTPERPPAAVPPNNNTPEVAHIGSSLTLTGFNDERVRVTVLAYLDPITTDEFSTPPHGAKFVGVQLRLMNVGNVTYSDSASNGAQLITNTDEQAGSDPFAVGGNCEDPGHLNISPGDTRVLCLPFEMPAAQRGRTFQFTLDSGFADQTGEWSLGR